MENNVTERVIKGEKKQMILFTQPLFKDGFVKSEMEQLIVYKNIINEYYEKNFQVTIKPHPRDNIEYSNLIEEYECSIIAIVIVCGYLYIYNFKQGKVFYDKKIWRSSFLFNLPLIWHYLSTMILNQCDRIMISKMIGNDKAGMDVIFCVRILYIVDSINKIIDHIDDFDLSPLAREWFAGFGKIGGDVIHLVIGLLIGFDNAVSLKECLLLDEANRIVDNYEWMNFPEFGLEIDVQNTDVIFFHPGQHPLENEKVKKCIFETVIELDKFSVEQQSALREVCKIITENMVSEAPTIDELKAAFNSVMLPKTII